MTPHPEPGAELGPFRIGKRLGVGGMGIVFQALDTQLNRQVALKIITPHIGDDEGFRARFTREAQAQASLDSPHVVQVYSFGEADGRLYIASQLIPDGDLGQMLSRHGRPPARIAVNLISQVADGLADAHAAGLIHRDIKPANVLLRNRDNALHAYLGDFGIARQVGAQTQLTQAGGTVGTPSYMAPELHMGSDAGIASDVYSLGCLLWTTLSGKAPYAASTDYQVMMAHLERPVPQLAPTGPLAAEINRVLRAAMAKQPSQRYPSASAMRDDLRRVVRLPDDPVAVRPADEGGPEPVPDQAWQFSPPRTPTPVPTPTPTPSAPPAPPFRVPSPPPPSFSHATAPYSRPPQPAVRGSKRIWVVAAVLALVLGGAGVTVAVLLGDDDPSTPGSTETTAAPTEPTGPTQSTEPTGTSEPTDDGGSTAEEQRAIESLTTALAADGTADEVGARCLAEELVATLGVDGLIDSGVLNEDLTVNEEEADPSQAGELFSAIGQVAISCLDELSGSGF